MTTYHGWVVSSDDCESGQEAWDQWLERFLGIVEQYKIIPKWRLPPRLDQERDFESDKLRFRVVARVYGPVD